jgi:2-keto-4-pentenoate hydratase/2-oxohepta-3-ene-1,7-dioic acid hydratase in catechol pathway
MRVARIRTDAGDFSAVALDHEWAIVEDPFAVPLQLTGVRAPIDGTALLAPVVPKVVLGIAHNKTNNDHHLPIQVWHKSVRSICGPNDSVPISAGVGGVNIEGELAIVIGKPAYRLTLENAMDVVFGYTVANDVTNVDQVSVDEKFFQVKSGVNYAPIGPWIETEIADPNNEPIVVAINGVVQAESGTTNLPSTIAECLVYVTQWLELGPGDLILSGAPRTFLPTKVGDIVDITLPGIGTLTNTIVSESANA